MINSEFEGLDSLAHTTTVLKTSPENDPVQYVRQQFLSILGKQPEPSAHFYWSDLLIKCGSNDECLTYPLAVEFAGDIVGQSWLKQINIAVSPATLGGKCVQLKITAVVLKATTGAFALRPPDRIKSCNHVKNGFVAKSGWAGS